MSARLVTLIVLLVCFVGLGVADCAAGSYRTGVASILLGIVNYLLLI